MKKHITIILFFISVCLYSQNTPGIYIVDNVKVNTENSDFGTAFFGKNKVVFAAPTEDTKITKSIWTKNKRPFLDLYIGEINEKGEIVNKQKMPGDINTKYNEGVVAFTKDLKTVYFSANNYVKKKFITDSEGANNIQILKATIDEKGNWSNLILLPFNSPDFSTGHPTLNKDDTKLYFISDRPESIGRTDIFVVDILENGASYSEPRNLGPKINTKKREMFPFISDDNILYFSSDGHPGNGGLDVFASKIFDNTVSDPISLEKPVNGKKDDFAYIIDDSKHKGYFSSNRKGGIGDDDIYSFEVSPPIYIECNQVISGIVKDLNTQKILPGALIVLFDEQGNELERTITNEQHASFSFEQPCNTSYTIVGTLDGYLKEEIKIKTLNDLDLSPLEIFMTLPVDESVVVDVENKPISESKLDNKTTLQVNKPVIISNKTPKNNQVISGVVKDANTQKLLPGAIVVLLDEQDNELERIVADKNKASFRFKHTYNKTYKVEISLKEYLPEIIEIKDLIDANGFSAIEASMISSPDEKIVVDSNKTIHINTIYFDFDKYNIRSDAKFELDKTANIMKQHPDIKIEVSSHTDSRGTNAYNIKLSNNRAKSTIQYLIDKGIEDIRFSGKGYGEDQLAENCPDGVPCTEYRHQLNRRSEFLVSNTQDDISYKSDNVLFSDRDNANKYAANSGLFVNYNFNSSNTTAAYTVQVGAFRGKIQSKRYKKLTNVFNHRYDDGFNRYFAGKFKNSYDAKKYMSILRKKGFNGAFVVGLKGTDRF